MTPDAIPIYPEGPWRYARQIRVRGVHAPDSDPCAKTGFVTVCLGNEQVWFLDTDPPPDTCGWLAGECTDYGDAYTWVEFVYTRHAGEYTFKTCTLTVPKSSLGSL